MAPSPTPRTIAATGATGVCTPGDTGSRPVPGPTREIVLRRVRGQAGTGAVGVHRCPDKDGRARPPSPCMAGATACHADDAGPAPRHPDPVPGRIAAASLAAGNGGVMPAGLGPELAGGNRATRPPDRVLGRPDGPVRSRRASAVTVGGGKVGGRGARSRNGAGRSASIGWTCCRMGHPGSTPGIASVAVGQRSIARRSHGRACCDTAPIRVRRGPVRRLRRAERVPGHRLDGCPGDEGDAVPNFDMAGRIRRVQPQPRARWIEFPPSGQANWAERRGKSPDLVKMVTHENA